MTRPTVAHIDLSAIRHNYRIAKALAPRSRAAAVVKADGYGHGAVAVARALEPDADAFAVACVEEALELRESGIGLPILLLEGVFTPDELSLVDQLGLVPVVHCDAQLGWLLAARPSRALEVWLKMDTGMHRLGLPPQRFAAARVALARCPHVGGVVLMSHFARADELGCDQTARQLALFERYAGEPGAPRSLANSAAVLAWPAAHGDWVRPGIMLYGAQPLDTPHPAADRLRPAMTLESALIGIRELAAGETIGYGGRFVCDGRTRVGVVAVGYADGYPRHARDGTPVAVNGQPSRLIGRVSMDMITVDLTAQPEARLGDPVQLWGDQVPANAVAAASDTIAYQLFTSLSPRVPRRYAGDA